MGSSGGETETTSKRGKKWWVCKLKKNFQVILTGIGEKKKDYWGRDIHS